LARKYGASIAESLKRCVCGGRQTMSKKRSDSFKNADTSAPLFYHRRVDASGETNEIALGPCSVHALKWLVIFVLGVILAFSGRLDPSVMPLLHFILKLLSITTG
jgi:hypothetical protein